MNKVYVVNCLINNDWGISKIFDTRDKAMEFMYMADAWKMKGMDNNLLEYAVAEWEVQ